MATVTPIMPNASTQGISAPANAAASPDIGAMFAAMLANAPQDDAAQMAGGPAVTSNILMPAQPAMQIGASANNVAQPDATLPQNTVAPTSPDVQAALAQTRTGSDPAMAFAAPNIQTQTNPVGAPPQKDSTQDPTAMAAIMAAAQMPVAARPSDSTAPADFAMPKMPVALKPSAKQSPKSDTAPVAVPIPIAQTPIANTPVQAANAAVGDVMSAPKQAAPNTPSSSATPQQGDAAIVNAAAQTNIKPAPAAQMTQAQALPVQFDLSASGQNAQSNSGNPQHQSSQQQPQQQIAQTQAAPSAAPQHIQATPQNNSTATPQITTAMAIAPSPTTPVHVDTAVQVSAQNNSAPVPYNIGAIAVSIAAKSEAGVKHFDIRLDPPEMGVIDVRLSVDDSGKAVAHLSADKPQTLQLLQSDSSNLSRALKDSGVDLANNGLNFSLRSDQRQANQSSQQQRAPMRARARCR